MSITVPIVLTYVYIALVLRLLGLIGMLAVIFKMISQLRADRRLKTTKVILLIFGIAFFLGSFIPVQQNICYLSGCLILSSVIPLGIITAALNLISVTMFVVLYYTKEA